MYEILIISHGTLARGYFETMKMILGEDPVLLYCSLDEGESAECFTTKMKNIFRLQRDKDLLILADIYYGSPCQSAITGLMSRVGTCYLVAGMNLPLVIEAYMKRNEKLENVMEILVKHARENVIDVNQTLVNQTKCSEDE